MVGQRAWGEQKKAKATSLYSLEWSRVQCAQFLAIRAAPRHAILFWFRPFRQISPSPVHRNPPEIALWPRKPCASLPIRPAQPSVLLPNSPRRLFCILGRHIFRLSPGRRCEFSLFHPGPLRHRSEKGDVAFGKRRAVRLVRSLLSVCVRPSRTLTKT